MPSLFAKLYRVVRQTRRAFTLIELLAVIAVIALLGALVLGLQPGNPKGLQGASKQLESLLNLAQAQAKLTAINDPDDEKGTNRYGTVRARLLILKDKENPENHLRLMGIVVGAQVRKSGDNSPFKTEQKLSNSDLTWYANEGGTTLLPDGLYYAPNDLAALKQLLRSDAENLTFTAPTMKLNFPKRKGQAAGNGREWYYYEFLSDGTCNMRDAQGNGADLGTGARIMIVQAELPPGADLPEIKNKENPGIVGAIITPRGKILPVTNLFEVK